MGRWGNVEALGRLVRVVHIPAARVYEVLRSKGIDVKHDEERNIYLDPLEPLTDLLDRTDEAARDGRDFLAEVGYKIMEPYRDRLAEVVADIVAAPQVAATLDLKRPMRFSVETNEGEAIEIEVTSVTEAMGLLKRIQGALEQDQTLTPEELLKRINGEHE